MRPLSVFVDPVLSHPWQISDEEDDRVTTDEEDGQVVTSYQASSPDEIAIVRWTEAVGLRLTYRDRKTMVLSSSDSGKTVVQVRVLDIFPFTQ